MHSSNTKPKMMSARNDVGEGAPRGPAERPRGRGGAGHQAGTQEGQALGEPGVQGSSQVPEMSLEPKQCCGDSCPEVLSRGAPGVGRACPGPEGNGNSYSSCPEKKKECKLSPGLSTLLRDVHWGGKGRGLRIRCSGLISVLPLADCEALSK